MAPAALLLRVAVPLLLHAGYCFTHWASKVAVVSTVYCQFYECCNDKWIRTNITDLDLVLSQRVYGQHLVKKAVSSHLQAHVRSSPHPCKALALSFHGPTGTGKNHVSRIIAEAIYENGMKSSNVVLLSAAKEFLHQEMLPSYKDMLKEKIEKQVAKCPRSLFIFDEIDKMPVGLLDTVTPYLDYHESLGGVDYRRATFLFISNTGSSQVFTHVFEQWKEGRRQEDLKLKEMENILIRAAINSMAEGGLYHSGLISKHLITAFLPFLPLERKHVKNCIRDAMVARKYYPSAREVPESRVDEVLQELTFYPEKEQLFSVTGCKRIAEKVDFVMID